MATKKGKFSIILEVQGSIEGQVHTYNVCKDIAKGDATICADALQAIAPSTHKYSIK